MQVSGGHLCETEAPTEPTGKTAAPYSNEITDTYKKSGVILITLSTVVTFLIKECHLFLTKNT